MSFRDLEALRERSEPPDCPEMPDVSADPDLRDPPGPQAFPEQRENTVPKVCPVWTAFPVGPENQVCPEVAVTPELVCQVCPETAESPE